jgi:alpha-ketoglutarate-dependent taurine dioxygenase
MAPSAVAIETEIPVHSKQQKFPTPLKSSGSLDKYESIDSTPVIGTEYPTANLVDFLNAPNSDELIRDLAIKISERGVVFFRAQDNLTNDLQKQLIQKLGQLAGKPSTSGLHIHPILNSERELGGSDPEISTISSEQFKKLYRHNDLASKKQSSAQWHADISFEPVPADYTSLRLVKLPRTGGDTLWASGYEIYDKISAPFQKFLETLTATFGQPGFKAVAERSGFELYTKERGAPENVGGELEAVHPVVRTNPGKSRFGQRHMA